MNNYIINIGTKLFNEWDIYNKALSIFNSIDDNNKKFYWISFWNEFCEHLNINLTDSILEELNSLKLKLFYKTSIITNENRKLYESNIDKLQNLKSINFVINDLFLLNYISNKNIILWVIFNRTRVLIRKNLLENINIPNEFIPYINKEIIKNNQFNIYKNTFDNNFFKKFITDNNIKWISLDISDLKIDDINSEIYLNSNYTYVMSWRNCITHKIINKISNTNLTTSCNKECYDIDIIKTNYNWNILWKDLFLIWNTIFTNNSDNISNLFKDNIEAIFYNEFLI